MKYSQNEIKQELQVQLENIEEIITCYAHKSIDLEQVANNTGYTVYNNALVINVKDRPYIQADNINPELITQCIYEFSQELFSQYDDFVIEGRSGGYWGLNNFADNIHLNINSVDVLHEDLINTYNEYKHALSNYANDVTGLVQCFVDYIVQNKATEYIENIDLWEINSDYINRLNNLRKTIDYKEKELQKNFTLH